MRTMAQRRRKAPFTWSWAWLTNWLHYKTPYDGDFVRDPLFATFARRVPWMQTPVQMRRFHRNALLWGTGSTALLLALFSLLMIAAGEPVIVLSVLLFAMGISVLAGFIVDFFCLYYAVAQVRFVRREQIADLLRISAIFPSWLVESRFYLARLYAWRALYILLATRFAIMGLFVICAVVMVVAAAFSGDFTRYDMGGVAGYT
ncbi:MAG: hypothetical protein AAF653_18755, partial [Chloroflexota bacterium]